MNYDRLKLAVSLITLFHEINAKKPPNILFIIADDLGWADVGFHGAKDVKTPVIDNLAHSGVILNNYYVQPICTPTRAQIMTGRYAGRMGLNHHVIFSAQPNGIPLDEVLLPEYLKKHADYRTHLIGKWHLGMFSYKHLPTRRGFDSFFGYTMGEEDYFTKETMAACPHDDAEEPDKNKDWHYSHWTGMDFLKDEQPYKEANGTYSTEIYTERVKTVLKEHKHKHKNKPLFMMVAPQNVHFPQEVPDRFVDPGIKDPKRRIHSAMVSALDEFVGNLTNAFKTQNMLKDTLIVFTTDNGGQTIYGSKNTPLRGKKDTLYQGGIRGTAFINGKMVENPGTFSDYQMQTTDWLPTLIQKYVGVAKFEPVNDLDGISVDVNEKGKKWSREILVNIDRKWPSFKWVPHADKVKPVLIPYPNRFFNTTHGNAAILHGQWKLITGDPGWDGWSDEVIDDKLRFEPEIFERPSVRLYDLESDPEERENLALNKPDLVNFLLERLHNFNSTIIKSPYYPACDPACDPALRGDHWLPWKP